jgi:hypothetical protein
MDIDEDFWPGPLGHCALPLLMAISVQMNSMGVMTDFHAKGTGGSQPSVIGIRSSSFQLVATCAVLRW